MPIKKIIITIGLIPVIAITNAQTSYSDSIKFSHQLIQMEQQLMDDIPSGQTIHWEKYLHKDFFIITEDGSMLNKKSFLETFRVFPKGISGHINVIKPKVVFHGNTAVIHYVSDEYEDYFNNNLHTQYSTMNTYIRTDTSWAMISSQVFEIPLLPPSIKVPGEVLKKYVGKYKMNDSTSCTISIQQDTLFYQRSGRPKITLLPETENIFFRQGDARGRKIFSKDENGVMLMRERRNGQDVTWRRIE